MTLEETGTAAPLSRRRPPCPPNPPPRSPSVAGCTAGSRACLFRGQHGPRGAAPGTQWPCAQSGRRQRRGAGLRTVGGGRQPCGQWLRSGPPMAQRRARRLRSGRAGFGRPGGLRHRLRLPASRPLLLKPFEPELVDHAIGIPALAHAAVVAGERLDQVALLTIHDRSAGSCSRSAGWCRCGTGCRRAGRARPARTA